jgi:hypothetical protein
MSEETILDISIEEWHRRYTGPLCRWRDEIAQLRGDILQRHIARTEGIARWQEVFGRYEQHLEELRRTGHVVDVDSHFVSISIRSTQVTHRLFAVLARPLAVDQLNYRLPRYLG